MNFMMYASAKKILTTILILLLVTAPLMAAAYHGYRDEYNPGTNEFDYIYPYISDHEDVDTSGVTDGQGIKWDNATSKWVPITFLTAEADTLDTVCGRGGNTLNRNISFSYSGMPDYDTFLSNLNGIWVRKLFTTRCNIVPYYDGSYDIGTSTMRYRDLYLEEDFYHYGTTDAGVKYTRHYLKESDDYYWTERETADILGWKIDMPLDLIDNAFTTEGKIHATGGGQTGVFQTGLAGYTVLAYSGGGLDIRAGDGNNASQNVMRVDNSGNFDFYGGNITNIGTLGAGATTITGDLTLPQYIKHTGDVDTHIAFTANVITFTYGGTAVTGANIKTAYDHSQVSGGIHEDWTSRSSADFETSGKGVFGSSYVAYLGDDSASTAGYFYDSYGHGVQLADGNYAGYFVSDYNALEICGDSYSINSTGSVRLDQLPTSDPYNWGELWDNSGYLMISQG